jgi:hypothetical protein
MWTVLAFAVEIIGIGIFVLWPNPPIVIPLAVVVFGLVLLAYAGSLALPGPWTWVTGIRLRTPVYHVSTLNAAPVALAQIEAPSPPRELRHLGMLFLQDRGTFQEVSGPLCPTHRTPLRYNDPVDGLRDWEYGDPILIGFVCPDDGKHFIPDGPVGGNLTIDSVWDDVRARFKGMANRGE